MHNKTIKKTLMTLLFIILCFTLSGCWNYRSLSDLTIVMGMTIDKDATGYKLSYEIIDFSKTSKQTGVKTLIIEANGKTIFEADRNAKKRIADKLYYGNMEVLIISNKVATEDGLSPILDWFLRNGESRETLQIAISQDEKAADILKSKSMTNSITSMDVKQILYGDKKISASTRSMTIHEAYSTLRSEGLNLVLPALHTVTNNEEKTPEVNGVAVFKKDKLVGYLTPEETFYYLFVMDEIKGGALSLNINSLNKKTVSLNIAENKTKKSYTIEGDKVKVKLKINTTVSLEELETSIDVSKDIGVDKIESFANKALIQGIKNTVKKVQTDFDSDIFGFGNMIYKKDYKTWYKLKEMNWGITFKKIELDIEPKVVISNTEYIQ